MKISSLTPKLRKLLEFTAMGTPELTIVDCRLPIVDRTKP
jgi:hypothetical protein